MTPRNAFDERCYVRLVVAAGLLGLLMGALSFGSLVDAAHAQSICYKSHVQDLGWQAERCNGTQSGSVGAGLRLEAFQIKISGIPNARVCYRAYVQKIGWSPAHPDSKCDGLMAGTTFKSLRVEAMQIWLENAPADFFVHYKCHLQGIGWTPGAGIAKQGPAMCGTTGESRRLEAFAAQIKTPTSFPSWSF